MKKILILIVLAILLPMVPSSAQSGRTDREKAWRTERQRQRAEARAVEVHQDSVAYRTALSALKAGRWVLEADNINFPNGIMRFVSSETNYISGNDGEGTIQTAYSNFTYSPNGLGGVTIQGDICDVRMSTDKDGNVYYNYSIQSSRLSATVNLILTGGTNQASATVYPNFGGGSITFDGYLVPYTQSTIFQGMPQW